MHGGIGKGCHTEIAAVGAQPAGKAAAFGQHQKWRCHHRDNHETGGKLARPMDHTTQGAGVFVEKRRNHSQGGEGKHYRSEEHTSELQSQFHRVCRLLLEKMVSHARQYSNRCSRSQSNPTNNGSAVLFFNDTATTEIYPLSLHDALPISL